jgi:hypothetical protein
VAWAKHTHIMHSQTHRQTDREGRGRVGVRGNADKGGSDRLAVHKHFAANGAAFHSLRYNIKQGRLARA